MEGKQRPIKRPGSTRGCESCEFRSGDFWKDPVYQNVVRIYCKARKVEVDAEAMSKDCDFFKISPDYITPRKDDNRYGL